MGINNLTIYGLNRCDSKCKCCRALPENNICDQCYDEPFNSCIEKSAKVIQNTLDPSFYGGFQGWVDSAVSSNNIPPTLCQGVTILGGHGSLGK